VIDARFTSLKKALCASNVTVTAVVHTACKYSRDHAADDDVISANLDFGVRIFGLATELRVNLFISVDTILTPGHSVYADAKAKFREFLKRSNSDFRILNLRFDIIYGYSCRGTDLINSLLKTSEQSEKTFKVFNGGVNREFLYVDEVASGIYDLIQSYDRCDAASYICYRVEGHPHTIAEAITVLSSQINAIKGGGSINLLLMNRNLEEKTKGHFAGTHTINSFGKISLSEGVELLINDWRRDRKIGMRGRE
jgi:nucleoside-diphosphate-sugar epimerase